MSTSQCPENEQIIIVLDTQVLAGSAPIPATIKELGGPFPAAHVRGLRASGYVMHTRRS